MIQYIIYRLTYLCEGIIWQLYANVSPRSNTKTRLTFLYIVISSNSRVAPNGSLSIWWGYASKWSHPP